MVTDEGNTSIKTIYLARSRIDGSMGVSRWGAGAEVRSWIRNVFTGYTEAIHSNVKPYALH
jgi:hypothetical protein